MNKEKIQDLEKIINEKYSNITGVAVLKNNEKVYEKYFNGCDNTSTIHIYSVTKSIISILMGIAIDKGYIKSIDEKVLDFFPNYEVKGTDTTIEKIKLKDIMTMTVPYKSELEPYVEYFTSDNFTEFALDFVGGDKEIGEFRYAPIIGPDILTGILTKVTGKSVIDFAREYLFDPLGITVEKNIIFQSEEEQFAFYQATNISGWVVDKIGVNTAGWGLTLSTMDMAKIGQLYLDNGIWDNKQIVSTKWIQESTKEHSRWEELNLPYGYLWWVGNDESSWFAAMGDGGNVIYVNKEERIVVAITAIFAPNVNDRIEFIKEYIEHIFKG